MCYSESSAYYYPFEKYDSFLVATKDNNDSMMYMGYSKELFDIIAEILGFR